jgi:hypothetical protein
MARNDLMGAEIMDISPWMPAEPGESEKGDKNEPEGLQALITRSIEEAIKHFEENIEPEMTKATDYYFGRPFGDEQKGRSQVVSTDVRDATLDQIPDLMEIFMGSDSVVEFKPRSPEDVPRSQQATDAVNYVFYEENDGFLIMNAVLKDAGVRRLGYVKWWYEEVARVRGKSMTGLSEEEVIYLEEQKIDYTITGTGQDVIQVPGPDGRPVMQPIETYSVDIRLPADAKQCYRVEEVPPEEVVWTPEARKFSRAPLIAHVREVTQDDLLRMGIPQEFIDEHKGIRSSKSTESLPWARQFYGSSKTDSSATSASEAVAESQTPVLFAEAYALVDSLTRPGQSELRLFQCVGDQFTIWNGEGLGELTDEVQIAVFTPDPEPHTIPGLCNYDYLKEIQRVKSQIQRGQLNSLAQSIEQQLVVSMNEVNPRDLLSPEISGIIRVRKDVNAIREIKHTFVGADTLPVLEYYDQIKADRIGRKGPNEGLDANVLQSTTAEAVSATLSRAQQRIRMVARVYAETGFKTLFKGIYRMLCKHQKREMLIRLRNEYVPVDPSTWDPDMDVRVNVALGTGSKGQRILDLQALAAKQEEHITNGSPLVSYVELRKTYAKLTDLMGEYDTDAFFKPWTEQDQQALDQAQAEAAKNNKPPEVAIVEVEELKVQLDAQVKQRQNELKELELRLEDAREREKMRLEHEEALAKLEVDRIKAKNPPTPSA